MLRLPAFDYLQPRTAREAAGMAATIEGSMFVAGGTDLFPKMKRRQMEPPTLVGVGGLEELGGIRRIEGGFMVGAGVTLEEVSRHPELAPALPGYAEAAESVSSPPLRASGTVGGNLCVDTRCNYYDMTYEWRRSVGFCMKKDGDVCLVAPGSRRCWAVSSTDTAPMAIALGAAVTLVGPDSERELPVAALYQDDGIDHLAKRPHEVVRSLHLPATAGMRSAYVKLRRRGSIDFPIAGAAVAMNLEGSAVASCRIVLSAVGSRPVEAEEACKFLVGRSLDTATIMEAGELAARPAKPLDNADLTHFWRKRMVRVVVERAIQKCLDQAVA